MIKDRRARERLAEVDAVVFDKTGTLTSGQARLVCAQADDPAEIAVAAAMARHSRHPYALAIAAIPGTEDQVINAGQVQEHPGEGLEARIGFDALRLGRILVVANALRQHVDVPSSASRSQAALPVAEMAL
ncbi:HAD family hydrolase [Ancylobacter sp. A5.8]|uniref:HAD family hydrolase n=1 Tax=Ancylobacter gelatini TaxID=2919920 RepID=UPI001F4E17BA|nr:HAD family hydrolase [Ancylobacter gelatini]MCJ8143300.1 HAD family hydrolase [Ancylobacter gelatini]